LKRLSATRPACLKRMSLAPSAMAGQSVHQCALTPYHGVRARCCCLTSQSTSCAYAHDAPYSNVGRHSST
jgi:hypothetical protein